MKNIICLFLLIASLNAFSQTYSGTGGAISDDGSNNDFPINISGLSPAILNSSHGLVSVCLNITHSYDSDLKVDLIAPDGTEVMLFSAIGGGGNNFTNTCFSQNASTPITSGSAPFNGTYKPMNNLGDVNNGQSGNGIWKLRIVDTYPADAGTLNNWSITFGANAPAPNVLTTSNLPIVVVNTFSQTIVNEPKINAHMKIIDNGPGAVNHITDAPNAYNNNIGIEIRGNFSAQLPQKPYAIETRNSAMQQNDTVILNMLAEHDWNLMATYNDKVYVRNSVANKLFQEMGHYAAHSKPCELVLNGKYQGIYFLSESIKRDNNRVDISKLDTIDNSGIQLTGGYILKSDYWDPSDSWELNYHPIDHPTLDIHLVYEYPKPDKITPAQKNYIQTYINSFETALYGSNFADPSLGYRAYMSLTSFIDYFIVNELSRNQDGYRKSWFMHKNRDDKGGKLKAGPVWDFDWAWKNIQGCNIFSNTNGSGWSYKVNDCSFDANSNGWYVRMMQDSTFRNQLNCRWTSLRSTILDTSYLFNYIDSMAVVLDSAQQRHQAKWVTLGVNVGTPEVGAQPTTFQGDINLFKSWIKKRINWLDANMPGNCTSVGLQEFSEQEHAIKIFPNPTSDYIFINGENRIFTKSTIINVSDMLGREIISKTYLQVVNEGMMMDLSSFANGTYFCKIMDEGKDIVKPIKLIIQK